MEWTNPWLTHLVVFFFGVSTGLSFTLWEGNHIKKKHRGELSPMATHKHPQPVTRNQTIVVFILLVSIVMLGLGFQQMQYQRQANSQAKHLASVAVCYRAWGKEVVASLEARSTVDTTQAHAQQARNDAVDGVLLVALHAAKAGPHANQAKETADFYRALNIFGRARASLVAANAKVTRTKNQNPIPQLNCLP